ncbi:hypothetical protein NP493_4067g00009 [Ridgeia piscesae]|uniref:Uncharacterized protein n=1 Tax=Ridgeia piscesae TaxID=27915 RepID=A0AAD9J359_RIDPI|nr:hypothetical protein NP493_4067g00009 [Ridgeia piscesae]
MHATTSTTTARPFFHTPFESSVRRPNSQDRQVGIEIHASDSFHETVRSTKLRRRPSADGDPFRKKGVPDEHQKILGKIRQRAIWAPENRNSPCVRQTVTPLRPPRRRCSPGVEKPCADRDRPGFVPTPNPRSPPQKKFRSGEQNQTNLRHRPATNRSHIYKSGMSPIRRHT